MTAASDADGCRRALREMREIVAVSRLPGSPMSPQETLRTLAAIVGWTWDERLIGGRDCAPVMDRLHDLTRTAWRDDQSDREALDLYDQVVSALGRASPSADAASV